uniref:(northern house mosquito) hypothetical protein n=1 Tax=Culex pipiens TaxID=7175 RepID=A0A8D8G9G6_CULPI
MSFVESFPGCSSLVDSVQVGAALVGASLVEWACRLPRSVRPGRGSLASITTVTSEAAPTIIVMYAANVLRSTVWNCFLNIAQFRRCWAGSLSTSSRSSTGLQRWAT